MDDKELEKLKAEISYHATCKPCRACGECERILDIAIKERRELQGEKATKRLKKRYKELKKQFDKEMAAIDEEFAAEGLK